MPLMTPVDGAMLNPAGIPNPADQVYGSAPPAAVRVWVYAWPARAAGRGEAVVIDRTGAEITRENVLVFASSWESATRIVTV